MATATLATTARSLADVVHDLGDIPLERIGFPVGTATEKDVLKHLEADDKRIYELIDGVLVEKPMGMRESMIAFKCGQYIGNYLDDHDIGVGFTADGPVRLKRGRIRFPDTGFVSWDRIPDPGMLDQPILEAVPNLAIEVISKSNTPREMELKLTDYFNAGVGLVWYIYPKTQTAIVYTSPTSKKEVDKDGILDGGKVLPGFSLPLKKLFVRAPRGGNGKARRGNSK